MAGILAAMPVGADRNRIVRGIGPMAMQYWKRIATSRLRSSSRDYKKGLQYREVGGKAYLTLVGRLPNMIEHGWPGGDMRDWMLSGPGVKQGLHGPYRDIQFGHGAPGTSGRNVGPPVPKGLHSPMAKLKPTLSRPGKRVGSHGGIPTVWGERLHPGRPMKDAARAILNRTEKPHHATSIYTAMVRHGQHEMNAKGESVIKTSHYSTYRRISRHKPKGVRAASWMHGGIEARNLAKEVQAHVKAIAAGVVIQATR
jgi:hypothetical protein